MGDEIRVGDIVVAERLSFRYGNKVISNLVEVTEVKDGTFRCKPYHTSDKESTVPRSMTWIREKRGVTNERLQDILDDKKREALELIGQDLYEDGSMHFSEIKAILNQVFGRKK